MKSSAKVRANLKKILPLCLAFLVLGGIFGCADIEKDAMRNPVLNLVLLFFGVPVTQKFAIHRGSRPGAQLHALGTPASPPPNPNLAPFFGNLSAVTLPPTAPANDFFLLQRQSDCSLTFLEFAAAINGAQTAVTITPDVQTPNYEKVIHNNAFLTTTPDTFAGGCPDTSAGNSSRLVAVLGVGKDGREHLATPGDTNVIVSGVKADGTFTGPTTLATDLPPGTLVGGDFNKDGNPDLVSVNTSGLQSSITVFLGKDDGTYQPGVNLALPGTAAQYAVVDDLDGDGNLDILVSSEGPSFAFSVFLGNGNGTFKPAQTVTPTGNTLTFSNAFITADVNGDHKKDIVAANGQVFLGSGDGITYTLVTQRAFPPIPNATNGFAPSIVAADFNNDGKLDLATDDGNTIRTFKGNGDGTFVAGPSYAAIPDFSFMIATDLDGDGNVDLWGGYGGHDGYGGDAFNLGYALMGNGDGTFQGAPSLPVSFAGSNLADLDGDGHLDLIGTSSTTNTLTFLTEIEQPNGTFKPGPTLVPPVNDGAESWAVGDFNGDNIPDLIYLNISPNTPGFYVALGNGDGSFQTPVFTPAPNLVGAGANDINETLAGVHVADFNHDGKLDIAYSFFDESSVSQLFLEGFAVQLGKGDGTFQAPVITTTFSSLTAPQIFFSNMLSAVQDVNGDNFPDVFMVVPNGIMDIEAQHQTKLFIGNGDGSFKPPTTLTLTENMLAPGNSVASPFAFGDINGDGKIDLITGGSSIDGTTPQLAIALGNGDGTFQTATAFTLEGFGFVNGLALADFDGDGKLDLFCNVPIEGETGIFTGNGNGTFQSFSNPDGTISPTQVFVLAMFGGTAAADLNGDGKPDLIVGNVVLLNETGAVAPPVLTPTTTTLASAPPSPTAGQTVTLTATIGVPAGDSTVPTGSVSFSDGATPLGTSPLQNSGTTATFATSTLSVGPHSITATYSGDGNFATSTSTAVVVTIAPGAGKASTATVLTAAPNPAASGANVTFTATVTSTTAGAISGSVTFLDGASTLGTGPVGAGGVATFSTTTLSVATHSVTAQYGGDTNFAASTSTAVSVTINGAASFTLSVAPSIVTVTPSQPGVATVTVKPANGFNQAVQFSCSNVPEGIDCEFEPQSATPNGGPATTMLSVSEGTEPAGRRRKTGATIAAQSGPGESLPTSTPAFVLPLKSPFVPLLGCELLLLAGLWRRRKSANRRGLLQIACAVLLFATIATFAACTNTPHSKITSVTITVMGTGPNNQTATVPLSVRIKK